MSEEAIKCCLVSQSKEVENVGLNTDVYIKFNVTRKRYLQIKKAVINPALTDIIENNQRYDEDHLMLL